ncbi:MAG TPA: ABC transporter permease [Saprospiraceae bacterium]|nr:ABC transporter permease [Saprospiraceae bacterium]HNT21571.1 ABC transporter permease [Saprospiraceae bacterium]
MFSNYFKTAWRNLLKYKTYSGINILGLATGLAAFILISTYVRQELSFDRFNAKADRIYRLNTEIKFGDNHLDLAVCSPLVGETILRELPSVEQVARLRWYGEFLVKKEDENVKETNVAWADASLFEVFSLPMIAGDPETALKDPGSIVLTETVARKYFNSTDIIGKILTVNNREQKKITGVIRDLPNTCHFQFTSFLPNADDPSSREDTWAGSQNWNTYVLLKPGTALDQFANDINRVYDKFLEPQLQKVINKSLSEFNASGDFFKLTLTKLTDIHLRSSRAGELYGSGSLQNVYIFSAIALFILLIASINFMNLSTARSSNRAREVGVRKVLGSSRPALISQFISESFLTVALALILAVCIGYLALPYFNTLVGAGIDRESLISAGMVLPGLALILGVGLLAGSYPAFYLSSFIPVKVLKSLKGTAMNRSLLRNALVVFQFSTSVVLIAGTLIVYRQMDFIRKKDIGYNRDQMLIINNTSHLGNKIDAFRLDLLRLNGVDQAAVSGFLPVNYHRTSDSYFPDASLSTRDAISMQSWGIDEYYIPALEMKILKGRNFSPDRKSDSLGLILNESAARFFGAGEVIGKKLYQVKDESTKELAIYEIIGVVKDFNYSTFRDQVQPLCFTFEKDPGSLSLRMQTANIPDLLAEIKTLWKSYLPSLPFEYYFMDDEYNRRLEGEQKTGELFSFFAMLAIFIACLGLFGLSAYMAEQRAKEIGIRKVLGASVSGITQMLSRDFLKLILISIVLAVPVAYFLMNRWLQEFSYRVGIQAWVFLLTAGLILLIAVLTVSFQAVKAALANPVKSLRTE